MKNYDTDEDFETMNNKVEVLLGVAISLGISLFVLAVFFIVLKGEGI